MIVIPGCAGPESVLAAVVMDSGFARLARARQPAPRRISVMRNDSVVAAESKRAVTFYVNGVARFTFFRREDRFDCSNELIAG
jgi:nickel-dependent lactate racemase